MGGASGGRQDAGAASEGRVGREAPVRALQQDLRSQTPEKVVDKDRAAEEGFGVIDETHLVQREAQHVGPLLQDRSDLRTT